MKREAREGGVLALTWNDTHLEEARLVILTTGVWVNITLNPKARSKTWPTARAGRIPKHP